MDQGERLYSTLEGDQMSFQKQPSEHRSGSQILILQNSRLIQCIRIAFFVFCVITICSAGSVAAISDTSTQSVNDTANDTLSSAEWIEDIGDDPTFILDIPRNGDPYAIGIPSPLAPELNSVEELFEDVPDGAVYTHKNGTWQPMAGDDTIRELDVLVVVLQPDSDDPTAESIERIRVSLDPDATGTAERQVDSGWALVPPVKADSDPDAAFAPINDSVNSVEGSIKPPESSMTTPPDSGEFDPFSGYFVQSEGGTVTTELEDRSTLSNASNELGYLTGSVEGTVRNVSTGERVEDVPVGIADTTIATRTDRNGRFTLDGVRSYDPDETHEFVTTLDTAEVDKPEHVTQGDDVTVSIGERPRQPSSDVLLPDDGSQSTLFGSNTVLVSTDVSDENETTVHVPSTRSGTYTGTQLRSVTLENKADDEVVSFGLEQREGPAGDVPGSPTNDTILTHYRVHTDHDSEPTGNVTFQFELEAAVVNESEEVTVHRHDSEWESLDTEVVGETEDGYLVEATTPGFSTFAVSSPIDRFRGEPTVPDVIKSIEIRHEQDPTDAGYLSSFDVIGSFNASQHEWANEPTVRLWIGEYEIQTKKLDEEFDGAIPFAIDWGELNEIGRGEYEIKISVHDGPSPTETPVDHESDSIKTDALQAADDPDVEDYYFAAGSIYTQFESLFYNASDRRGLAEDSADDAADIINERLEDAAQLTARDLVTHALSIVASKVTGGLAGEVLGYADAGVSVLEMIENAADAAEGASTTAVAVQQESTAIYLDESEPTTSELRRNLDALARNSEALHQARVNGENDFERELLMQRRDLLTETYALLVTHLEAVHANVISDSVGVEDRHTYQELRWQSEQLRNSLLTDHMTTTKELFGTPESLAATEAMPTHGWERDDRSVVYDTQTHDGDYTVYRIDIDEDQLSDDPTVRIQGGSTDGFDAFVTRERPTVDNVNSITGTDLSESSYDRSLRPTRSHEFEEAEEHYLVVRGAEEFGQYRAIATTTAGPSRFGEAVTLEPIMRANPPDLRPDVALVDGPEPFELEETDRTVRVTEDPDASLTWEFWDAHTSLEDLEYRYRIDRGDGFDELTDWQSVDDEEGELLLDPEFEEGVNRVQIVVRNDRFMQSVDNVDVVVTTFEPQTYVATDGDPESNALFVKVLPDRRVDRIDVEYREAGDAEWDEWDTYSETTDFGRISVNEEGTFEFRARAVSPSGNKSDWDRTTFEYLGPPSVSIADAPERVNVGSGNSERITDADTVDVAWNVSSGYSDTTDLEYRTRTSLDGEWTSWSSVPASGTVERSDPLSEGAHEIEIEVRDEVDRVANATVDVTVDRSPPVLNVETQTGIERGIFELELDQRVRTVQVEYVPTDGEGRQALRNSSHVSENATISRSLSPGTHEVRLRAVDYTGEKSDWVTGEVTSLPAEDSSTPGDGNFTGNYRDGDRIGGGGIPIGGGGGGGGEFRGDFELITGEMIIEAYVVLRDGRSEQLASIELSSESSQTLAADVPEELAEDAEEIELRFEGDGEVFLDSLRAFRSDLPEASVNVEPEEPIISESTNLTLDTDEYVEDSVTDVEWDLTDDGSIDATGTSANHTFESFGNRTVSVVVTDVFDRTRTTPVNVTVLARPSAELSAPDEELTLRNVQFDARDSVDPDGTIESYDWFVDGEEIDATEGTVNRTFDRPGEYEIELNITDDDGLSDQTSRNVAIENRPPIVDLDVHTEETRVEEPVVDEPVTLDGGDSFDRDGEVVAYEWSIDGEVVSEEETLVETFEDPGEYEIELNVTDDWDDSNQTTTTIEVREQPEAGFDDNAPVLTFDDLILESTATTDPVGEIEEHQWHVDGDEIDEGSNVTTEFERPGEYNVTHRVVDDVNAVDEVTRNVTIENRLPIVEVAVRTDETRVEAPVVDEPVTFDGGDSFDRDGEIVAYEWAVDGEVVSDAETTVQTFEEPGEYEVTLNVTDDWGDSNRTSTTVQVREQPDADFEDDAPTLTFENITFDSTATTDPASEIEDYEWHVDGEELGEGETLATQFERPGEYNVTHRVIDDVNAVNETTRTVEIENRAPNVLTDLTTDETRVEAPVVEEPVTVPRFALLDDGARSRGFELVKLSASRSHLMRASRSTAMVRSNRTSGASTTKSSDPEKHTT